MLFAEVIRKTQHKISLSATEIETFIADYVTGKIPDYQMSAWLMAAYLNGLNKEETFLLTSAIRNSGETLNWSKASWFTKASQVADKHSTGGVGDKVSLILVPLALHFGLKVPMMSGRSLGHTGGTVDKLESIPGFSLSLSHAKLETNMAEFGAAMICQTDNLCPADKKLYALRDVTSTVDCVELITASIVSKKWAEGVGTIVYDVKYGSAAFMSTLERARLLANSLVEVSKKVGMKAAALITRMEEPLGSMVGNTAEVIESLWILKNEYPTDKHRELAKPLASLCCQTAATMAYLSGACESYKAAHQRAAEYLESGQGYASFLELAQRQGAHSHWEKTLNLPKAAWTLKAPRSGWVCNLHSKVLGLSGLELGMGRINKEDKIDPQASFEIHVAVGDRVQRGDAICTFYGDPERLNPQLLKDLEDFLELSDEKVVAKGPLLVETLL